MKKNHAEEVIAYIRDSKKKTPVKVYVQGKLKNINETDLQVFGSKNTFTVIGEWEKVSALLEENESKISYYHLENDRRNSAIPMLDLKGINARIEPGAIIRDQVEIGNNAVIMMGASINIGSIIGDGTMIDMNCVLGGRATVGKNCHIGAGTVLAGVIEPPSADPVVIEDDVVIGANAVVLEGVRVGKGAVVAAGAIVTENVPENAVVAGTPAKVIKMKDKKTLDKTELVAALREL